MKFFVFILLVSSFGCALLEPNTEFALTTEELSGEWIRSSFENQFNLYRFDEPLEQEDVQHINYSFVDNSYSTCSITHSEKPINYYYNCRWFLHGDEYPNLFLSMEYKIQDNPNDDTFRLLFKIVSKSDQSITLETIRRSF
ncbi:MAG: hypothetical protein JJ895_06060 [Balneolaceae bacterium]|nr:hypothetical protein [Balneolaceae bacterium]